MSRTSSPEAIELFKEIANEDADAYQFICLFSSYGHLFDDLIDKDVSQSPESLLELSRLLLRLTTCKFYDKYRQTIMSLQILIGESYITSEKLRKDRNNIQEYQYGLFLSHAGNDMLRFVALVTGGENHLNYISGKLRELTIKEHPDS